MQFNDIPYSRPDFSEFSAQFNSLLRDFNNAPSAAVQNDIMQQINDVRTELDTAMSVVSVRNSIDTTNSYYESEQDFMDNLGPIYSELVNNYYVALAASPYRADLERIWGKQLFRIAEMSAKCISPEVIEDLQKENHLGTEYQKLLASAKIFFDGEERNLAGMSPYMQSTDRDTRRAASEAKWNFFSAHREELDSIYDNLVKLRTSIAHKLGFENFVGLGYNRMTRSDYNPQMAATYRSYILKHIVPVTQKLRARQKERLGVEKLTIYDEALHFKSGNPTPKGGPEWIVEQAKNMYKEMSPETNEFFNFLCDYGLMDLVNRPTKAGGGYCTMFPKYKAPFIFSNFNGTAHDVDVLTHEAGHAFQCYMSRNNGVSEYSFPTLEACEIHSMSMEFFAWKWIKSFFKEDEDKYQFEHLSGALLFLPYGVTVDEFQHYVYENPNATPAQRKATWRDIEKKYLPHRNYDGIPFLEEGGVWQQQSHIYQSPFYYIDYTLAQICALQFWVRAKNDRDDAWKDYLELCKAGGKYSFLELVQLANLRSPFQEESFVSIIGDINNRLDGVPDAHFA
ncbi:MAG: M3 family oligoendopeptidase [Candidatus Kapabacteria bacterium]|nr:M3 family oligoendopeptidase [Candidatus Kapabacteria bacterium]